MKEYWSGLPCPPPGDLPIPGIEPRSPALKVDSLPSEPPGKPKNTGVGSLSLLLGIFPNPGIKPGSPALMEDSFPAELLGKPHSSLCKTTIDEPITNYGLKQASQTDNLERDCSVQENKVYES